jgi:hypothetical protein
MIQRREFITLLGGAAAWPLAAHAQQGDRVRRIGLLMPLDENDPLGKPYRSAFTQALADLGWADGSNMRMDVRWAGDDINRIRAPARRRPIDRSSSFIIASSVCFGDKPLQQSGGRSGSMVSASGARNRGASFKIWADNEASLDETRAAGRRWLGLPRRARDAHGSVLYLRGRPG